MAIAPDRIALPAVTRQALLYVAWLDLSLLRPLVPLAIMFIVPGLVDRIMTRSGLWRAGWRSRVEGCFFEKKQEKTFIRWPRGCLRRAMWDNIVI